MPTAYDCVDAKCPFFKGADKRSVKCDGVPGEFTISLKFPNRERKELHRSVFCDARYQYCEIYRVLEELYYADEK